MKRDERLIRLSREHHHGLVMALRIRRELPGATDEQAAELYSDLLRFWSAGLLNHFQAENGCLLARIAHRDDEGLRQAGRLQREHREMEELVETMRSTPDMTKRRDALGRFGEQLQDHIRWEERELFQWMESTLTDEELNEIGTYLEAHLPEFPVACPMPHTP
jgi:hemerythrin-like domain-containing protein